MKKLVRFRPALITKEFFTDIPTKQINRGRCFQWAYLTYRTFAGTELWSMGSHAFIKYKNKFYDAERLNGVSDWKDLPATFFGNGCGCKVCRLPAKRLYVPGFKLNWRGLRKNFGLKWNGLDKQALELIKKNT